MRLKESGFHPWIKSRIATQKCWTFPPYLWGDSDSVIHHNMSQHLHVYTTVCPQNPLSCIPIGHFFTLQYMKSKFPHMQPS